MANKDKKRGLGRGLSALMADVETQSDISEAGVPDRDDLKTISLPIETVFPNPDQPRKTFSEPDMDELVSSISEKGIIQPLIVRQIEVDRYEIVAGERRWRAAQRAQLHQVPVLIREFSDQEVLEIAIIENIQRADLTAIEEATAYQQLINRFGHTQDQIAQSLGKSRSHIANLLRLLKLPESVRDLVQSGQLSAGHARTLVTSENPERLAEKILKEGLTVREAEHLSREKTDAASGSTQSKDQRSKTNKDADTLALEGDLSATLGMKVLIDHAAGGDGGKITINYASFDQLDELCRMLGGM